MSDLACSSNLAMKVGASSAPTPDYSPSSGAELPPEPRMRMLTARKKLEGGAVGLDWRKEPSQWAC